MGSAQVPLALRHTENLEVREILKFGRVRGGVDKGLDRSSCAEILQNFRGCPDTNPISVVC